jgi:hypothetical protein
MMWPAPGSEDTELGVLMELEVGHGETEVAASPSGYSRGEGQKPVSKAYRDNWNVIFAKQKKR